jgi:peptide-methionine (R)-S-oxide reductase
MKNAFLFGTFILVFTACSQLIQSKDSTQKNENMNTTKYNSLTPEEAYVILQKGTDRPFTGDYYAKKDQGIYLCRQCNNPLYRSEDKFDSHCGWPSFDDEIAGAVIRIPDADGMRTEIICANCKGHLGHVFLGEGFTNKETRHCVNTSSLVFFGKQQLDSLPEVIR